MDNQPQVEVESTLVICAEHPERLADRVAGMRSIAGLVLREREQLSIVDTYVDLPGNPLGRSGLGLRLRRIGADLLLTFKGPTREVDGARIREELEDHWSASALEAVTARILDYGIRIDPAPYDSDREPARMLSELGFTVTQYRELTRRPRDVLQEPTEDALAELVVDAVTYRFGDRAIQHHEIEVEVKSEGGDVAMRRVIQALVDVWGARTRPWRHGKLATGRAVEALLGTGKRDELIDSAGRLVPRAYDTIDELLSSA